MAAGRTRCCSTRRTSSTPPSAATAGPATRGSPPRPTPRTWRSTTCSALDVDTPEDLLLAEATAPDAGGDRCRLTTGDGRVEVVALAGLPEIHEGDDLGRMIGDALEATPGRPAAAHGDVLVVTQKVVSKAEGAVVDLRTVEPRPRRSIRRGLGSRRPPGRGRPPRGPPGRADGARRPHHRDRHGFVCANGGVDAINVGPGRGSTS